MPLYDIKPWFNADETPMDGMFAITNPATFSRFSDLLTPYVTDVRPLQGVIGQDSVDTPTVTVPLRFPDNTTTAEVKAQIDLAENPAPDAPGLPEEVPMYKVLKYFAKKKAETGVDFEANIRAYMNTLPEPARSMALIDLDRSPNLVTTSTLALGAKAALSLTDAQYGQMVTEANAMP